MEPPYEGFYKILELGKHGISLVASPSRLLGQAEVFLPGDRRHWKEELTNGASAAY